MIDSRQNMTNSHTYDYPDDSDKRASLRVIEAIADLEDTDQRDLPPLANAVDPEAVNTLAQNGAGICFDYAGYEVYVLDSGDIVVQST